MLRKRRNNRTFYRYASAYFVVLFLLSGILLFAALQFSAKRIVSLEKQNLQNTIQRAADVIEKQYQTLESIAVQISASADYRPNKVNSGALYDIELVKNFKKFSNYSPLAKQYFLVYNSVNKIYTSEGNTSYFSYYAPVNLGIPYELTYDTLQKILAARSFCFERSDKNILLIYPLRQYGSSESQSASLCFVLTDSLVRDYLEQMTVGLPDQYIVSMNGQTLLTSVGMEQADAAAWRQAAGYMEGMSERGVVTFGVQQQLTGFQMLITQRLWIVLGVLGIVIVAVCVSLVLARFTLRPLDNLIKKYLPDSMKIENEFRELDDILGHLDQQYSDTRYQLKNQLLVMLLRGDYSDTLIERWAMLDITFEHPTCCVFLIENGASPENREQTFARVKALADETLHIYLAEMEEDDHLIVLANYTDGWTVEALLSRLDEIMAHSGLTVYAGRPVDSPKRLPLSFMAALTARQYGSAASDAAHVSAEPLAERFIAAIESADESAIESAGQAIVQYLSSEPLNGAVTKHHIYELIRSILDTAERKGIRIEKSEVTSLVMLPDSAMVVQDLEKILKNGMRTKDEDMAGSDDTARLIVDYVIANAFDPDINLADMSDRFGFSADYISSMIKRETGSAFKEYVTILRIGEARRLLSEDPGLTVNDVALKVGYRKASNFSKKFKELTGVLPSQIR